MVEKIKSEKGLTLMELIIVILILSVVMLAIFRFMDFGVDSFGFGVEQTEDQANLRLTTYKLTDTVRNVRRLNLISSLGDVTLGEYIIVSGDKLIHNDGVTSAPLSNSMITSATYSLTPRNGLYVLTVTIVGAEEVMTTEILLNNIKVVGNTTTTNLAGTIIEFDFVAP